MICWSSKQGFFVVWIVCFAIGCAGPVLRPQSPGSRPNEADDSSHRLISQVTHPYGMGYVKIESVALVTGLPRTGEDPSPSPQRTAILAEMRRRDVENPNQILASPTTSLVLVRGFLRPGIKAGDRFDVEVRVPARGNTTSLRGGQLLETRMTELAVLGDQIRSGHMLAVAKGTVLVDPTAESEEDEALARIGRVLGGGVATKSRNLGLLLDEQHQSIRKSQSVGKAINKRFFSYVDGQSRGVATPKTDEFIELVLHPRYQDNVGRYMRVIGNIAISGSTAERQERLQLLQKQLLDPVTAATAALRLEAIGDSQAVEVLNDGLMADDPEVRFYAAEALAYLDETAAVAPLAQAAREEPAFRVNALAALSAMDDGAAYESLFALLDVPSAETRYGAFRALWAMAPGDPRLVGEDMEGRFTYHVLEGSGRPLIHVTSSHRPEIVLFGREHTLKLPLVLDAGQEILVNGLSGGQIKVSRFGETTQQRIVSTDIDEVIRAVVELGGRYPDVVQMLQQAKKTGALASRFRVNALPESGRELLGHSKDDSDTVFPASYEVGTPEPELFGKKG